MTEVAANDVLKASWIANHTDPNTKIVQAFYWQVTNLVDGGETNNGLDLQTMCKDLFNEIQARLSTRYVLERIRCTNQTKKELLLDTDAGGFAGTNVAAQVLPAQDAALVVCRSRLLGHQGRKFLGPLPEDVVNNGALEAVDLPAFQAFADRWDTLTVGAVTGNDYTPGTVQFAVGGAVAGFKPFSNGLATAFSDLRTQRSRRPGVGLG